MMDTDVLIVGGGLSGLALADELHRKGMDFQLLEARDRFGGRIHAAYVNGAAFDLGPAWFWQEQPRMAAATKRFGLTVFEQFSAGDIVAEGQNGNVRRGAGFASMAGSLRIAGGMTALVNAFATAVPADRLHLGQVVTEISQSKTGVIARTDRVSISANKIILALPPRVAQAITFDPALPTDQCEAMGNVATWMAGHAKYLATYDKAHWRDAGLSGDGQSRRGPMVEFHDASPQSGGPYAVFGFVGFDANTRAAHRDEMTQMATDQLERLFGAKPRQLILQDWAQDTLTATPADHISGGHPAYGRPPALTNIWDGRIILGSSEMGQSFGGYLEGALEAAKDVGILLRQG